MTTTILTRIFRVSRLTYLTNVKSAPDTITNCIITALVTVLELMQNDSIYKYMPARLKKYLRLICNSSFFILIEIWGGV